MTSEVLKKLNLKLGHHVTEGSLDPVPRKISRDQMKLPPHMTGFDIWNAYEVSYLQSNGVPTVFHMKFQYSANTPNIVESKSFKLYLNSFNLETFPSQETFVEKITQDLEACVGGAVETHCFAPNQSPSYTPLPGVSLDQLEPEILPSEYDPDCLRVQKGDGRFVFHTSLLRTLCPVTGQPDWGNVLLSGTGTQHPEPNSLLAYIIGLRNHQDFHETCCEALFSDLFYLLKPTDLEVRCHYTRRGGLDINPIRSTHQALTPTVQVTWRQ